MPWASIEIVGEIRESETEMRGEGRQEGREATEEERLEKPMSAYVGPMGN